MGDRVVVDFGAHTIKVALCSKGPIHVRDIPSSMHQNPLVCSANPYDAHSLSEVLGAIVDSENGEAFSENVTLALLCQPLLPRKDRELLLHCMFEGMLATGVYLGFSAVTALFTGGETSGVHVDVGYHCCRCVPVLNALPLMPLVDVVDGVGAAAADSVLRRAWCAALGPTSSDTCSESVLLALKTSSVYVGTTPSFPAGHSGASHGLRLPDGTTIASPLDEAVCAEAGTALLTSPRGSVLHALRHVARKADLQTEHGIGKWMVSGGAAAVRGLRPTLDRVMTEELQCVRPKTWTSIATSGLSPQLSALHGAVILSQLASFKSMCIDRATYEEEGPHACLHVMAVDPR